MNTTATNTQYRIRIVHDSSAMNPFEDWDCEYPLMYESGRYNNDYSDGEIDRYLSDYLSYNQIIFHQKKILSLIDDEYLNQDVLAAEDKDEKVDIITDALRTYIEENIENKVNFCKEFNIKHYSSTSRGYSQGDWADVLIVPTQENANKLGYKIEDVTEEQLKATFNLFSNWMRGDTFGFIIEEKRRFTKIYENGDQYEDEEWEEIDSCFGFYGRGAEENGMIEYIDFEKLGMSRTQVIEIINDADVEYK